MHLLNARDGDVLTVLVATAFEKYLDAAALRLAGQFPSLLFHKTDVGLIVSGPIPGDEMKIRKAVLDAIYREKVYTETLSMRQALIRTVMEP